MLGGVILDDAASAGALSTGGTGVGKVVFPIQAIGLSILPCSMLELMGTK